MSTNSLSGRQMTAIVVAALVPFAIVVALAVAWVTHARVVEPGADAATERGMHAALAAIDGVTAVEDFGPYTDAYTKEIRARLVMDPASDVDPYLVLEQGARVLWTWPEWQPTITLIVQKGDDSYGANRLVDPTTGGDSLESSDATRMFGSWPGDPVPGLAP